MSMDGEITGEKADEEYIGGSFFCPHLKPQVNRSVPKCGAAGHEGLLVGAAEVLSTTECPCPKSRIFPGCLGLGSLQKQTPRQGFESRPSLFGRWPPEAWAGAWGSETRKGRRQFQVVVSAASNNHKK